MNGERDGEMEFDVQKIRGTHNWVVVHNGAVIHSTVGDKRHVLKKAATMNGITLKEFLKIRKGDNNG